MKLQSPAVAAALAGPEAAYGAVVRLRNAWYDRPGSSRRATIPVISVGNLAVGGTGKTPLVAWIAQRVHAIGYAPAVVSRGYGGTAGQGPLVVSNGEGPRVNARACGDEPHLLARSLRGTIVVVGSDRFEGVKAAEGAGAAVAILDDGFQHRRLARDLDVLVLDGKAPFADGHLLPRGTLREPPRAVQRAHVVVLSRLREGEPATGAIQAVRGAGFSGPIVRAGHRPTGFYDVGGVARAAPARAVAFCGIGNPDLFRGDLEASGVVAARFHAFRDHQPYTVASWETLVADSRAMGAPLVTTDKDFSRLAAALGASLAAPPLLVMRIETVVWDEAPLFNALQRTIARAGREKPR